MNAKHITIVGIDHPDWKPILCRTEIPSPFQVILEANEKRKERRVTRYG